MAAIWTAEIERAMGLHRAGERQAAAAIYRRVLQQAPDHPDALHLLGLTLHEDGRREEAIALIRQAAQGGAQSADLFGNLGQILMAGQEWAEAVTALRRAVSLSPGDARLHRQLARALRGAGDMAEAALAQRFALGIDGGNAAEWRRLGATWLDLGRPRDAEEAFRKALELDPDDKANLADLAAALRHSGRNDEALATALKAVLADPARFRPLSELGSTLLNLRLGDAAIVAYEAAAAADPGNATGHFNLGVALSGRHRRKEAVEAHGAALQADPGHVSALLQRIHIRQHLCDWAGLDREIADLTRQIEKGRFDYVSTFSLVAMPGIGAALQKRAAEQAAAIRFPTLERPEFLGPLPQPRSGERIRLGFLSSDLHEHATAFLLAELVELLDRDRFQLHAYSYGRDDGGPMRRRLAGAFDKFRDLAKAGLEETARAIRADQIDILLDLKGYTKDTRSNLLALRPAPVQINYLGFPATMGTRHVDYMIGDPVVTPPERARDFTEALALLPDCYQPNDRKRAIGPALSRRQMGLPDEAFVLCSFNQPYKITPDVFDVWCRLLKAIPDSVLWLYTPETETPKCLMGEAIARGVAPERLVFAGRLPLAHHLARLALADLLLDTAPCSGHTTASDALWAGLPLVTMRGDTFASRVAASLLTAMGLPELVCEDLAAYEATCLSLARRPERLALLRADLAERRASAPLFDTPLYVRNFGALMAHIAARSRAGQAPSLIRPEDYLGRA